MAERPAGLPALPAGLIAPMLATAGSMPTGAGWAFEIKFDGVRAVSYARGGGLRLYSRNDRDITGSYPEIAALAVEDGLVLDGELVAVGSGGRPDFELLQRRMHVQHPSPALVAEVGVQYVVFDVLGCRGASLLELPYVQRRAVLTGLGLGQPGLAVPANFVDTPGELVLAAAREQHLEGIVAKRLSSTYQPGRRSRAWVKSPIRHTAEVVIAGWSPAIGHRHVLGALHLAAHDEHGELVYVGDVGTGFTDAARRALLAQLDGLGREASPFPREIHLARGWPRSGRVRDAVHWVEPRLVGEVEYRAVTRDGSLRHPSWRGLRPDRSPSEVQRPEPDQ